MLHGLPSRVWSELSTRGLHVEKTSRIYLVWMGKKTALGNCGRFLDGDSDGVCQYGLSASAVR